MREAALGLWRGTVLLMTCALISCVTVIKPPSLPEPQATASEAAKPARLKADGKVVVYAIGEVGGEGSSPAAQFFLASHIEPISSTETVVQSFREGLRSALGDVQVVSADERFRTACIDSGLRSVESTGLVMIAPQPAVVPACGAELREASISYVIAIGGRHDQRGADTALRARHDHDFRLAALALDVRSAEFVCEAIETEQTKSAADILFFFVPLYVEVSFPDQDAFWSQLARRAGVKIGGCLQDPQPVPLRDFAGGQAQSVGAGGIVFNQTLWVGGQPLQLNGIGIRTRLFRKVYVGGLYVPKKSKSAAALLEQKGPRRIEIRFKENPGFFVSEMIDGLRDNLSAEQLAGFEQQMHLLRANFDGYEEDGRSYDRISFEFTPELGTRIRVNDLRRGSDIPDEKFFEALLRVWIGDKPVDADLKRGMLGG